MLVLGIESSCDETGVALYDSESKLLVDNIFSQIEIHREFGGVVPEIASRDHLKRLTPLLEKTLKDAKKNLNDIDLIAYTKGPGLVGALLTGATFANTLAFSLNIPSIGINHMEGHLLAPLINSNITFPFIALLVSGGHTQLIYAKHLNDYEILGESVDDAVGEAFDKVAKMMHLPYPGGPYIANLATKGQDVFKLPRPMLKKGFDFSFSGLKTACLTIYQKAENKDESFMQNLAKSFENAVVDVLTYKCIKALQETNLSTLIVAGGVSSNLSLREKLTKEANKHNYQVLFPEKNLCTDNGAMIAYAGFLNAKFANKNYETSTKARWSLEELDYLSQ